MSKGEAPMGRPIQRKWFGPQSGPGSQIIVTGAKFADGTTPASYIMSQTGDTAYMVQDLAKTKTPEILFLVNANATAALLPGQMYINATPFGGTALPAKRIAQYRISLYTVPNTVARPTGVADGRVVEYSWSTIPATKAGQATLITESATTGVVTSVTVGTAGAGYFTAPTVTFPISGTGATAKATVSATGTISGVAVLTGGSGYVTGGVATISPPPPSVTATATATAVGGIITAVTLTNGGGFYTSAPGVTLGGGGSGATVTAVISGGRVTGFTTLVGGTGYTAPTVVIGPPPVAVTALATFTSV